MTLNFKTRLRRLRNEKRLTQRELSKLLGISHSTISMYEAGYREPKFENLELIADFFNVDIDYLIGKSNQTTKVIIEGVNQFETIQSSDKECLLEYDENLASLKKSELFAMKIVGDCMEPRMHDGDIVIAKEQKDANSGDTVIVKINGNPPICRRIEKTDKGVMFIATNNKYTPLFFSKGDLSSVPVIILGKVVELRQKY